MFPEVVIISACNLGQGVDYTRSFNQAGEVLSKPRGVASMKNPKEPTPSLSIGWLLTPITSV